MKIRPLGDRVLVRPLEKEKQERSGIIIPDTAKEKPQEGEIVAAGKGKVADDGKVIPMEVKVGDKILYGKYSGTEIKIDDKEYLIMHQEDILGILESK
ncbi:MAG TPA: co-chaperone GroES [Elusimicrobiota bacterium]|nr:co-chaperone GroES [Elusimicrobiota bacterium]